MKPDISFVTSGHDVADARLHREVAAVVDAGASTEILGLGNPADAPKGMPVRTWTRGSMISRLWRCLVLPWRARGQVIVTLDPDVVPMMRLVRYVRRRRWVADVHEDYVALLADRSWAASVRQVVIPLTRWCIAGTGRADLTVVADEHVPPSAEHCRRRLVVRNVPYLPAIDPVPEGQQPLRAVYVGDVRTSRGLRTMVEAIAQVQLWTLDIVGPVASADGPWLLQRMTQSDVAGRVRLHGRLTPDQAWAVARECSVGLVLLADTPAFQSAMPTKVYEYLGHGLAVVCTPVGPMAELVREAQAGAVAADAQAAATQLATWAAHPAELRACRQSARHAAEAQLPAAPWTDFAAQVRELAT